MKATAATAPLAKTKVTYQDYLDYSAKFIRHFKKWRLGQCYFNALIDLRPDLSKRIKDWDTMNPYEKDENLGTFLVFVAVNWSN